MKILCIISEYKDTPFWYYKTKRKKWDRLTVKERFGNEHLQPESR